MLEVIAVCIISLVKVFTWFLLIRFS
ncbi:hypothetical protein Q604_UNBC13916G0001, partial [human gut metagenome]